MVSALEASALDNIGMIRRVQIPNIGMADAKFLGIGLQSLANFHGEQTWKQP
jgi:hypothetical protein